MYTTPYTRALYPYEALFTPLECGTLSLKNRIIAVPPDGLTALRSAQPWRIVGARLDAQHVRTLPRKAGKARNVGFSYAHHAQYGHPLAHRSAGFFCCIGSLAEWHIPQVKTYPVEVCGSVQVFALCKIKRTASMLTNFFA